MVLDAANASRGSARSALRAAVGIGALGSALVLAGAAVAYPLEKAALASAGRDGVLVLQSGTGTPMTHEVFCLEDPYRVVLDVFGADEPVALDASGNPLVSAVRSSVWKDDENGRIVRYVLETSVPVDYATETTGGMLELRLTPTSLTTDPVPMPDQAAAESSAHGSDSAEHGADAHGAYPAPAVPPAAVALSVDLEAGAPLPAAPTAGASSGAALTVASSAASGTEVATSLAAGQDAAPVFGTADPRATSPAQPTGGAGGGAAATRPMNLDVQNAEVRTVFRSISEFSGVNIVPDRDVTGPISIHLSEVPWRQALDIVAQSAGLIVVENNDILRVATARTYQAEEVERESQARKKEDYLPLETHVFRVGYANASELTGAVGLVLSDRGTVSFDSRTNALIISDIAPRIADASRLIQSLDEETQQVEIVARLVDMDRNATRRLGVTWNAENLGDADEGFSAGGGVAQPLTTASGELRLGLIRSWGNLDATLEAFEQQNEAEIISNPKIMTVNNHPAEILVGREIPLITLDEAGNPVTELKKVGIALRCTPYINEDGRITMDLHPEISDLSSQATVQGGLIFTTSEAQTRIMVEDGQTAVIGGLVRTNETEFEQGVPILREIPFLGHLFKSTDRVTEERELLIFVTPRIVTAMASNE